MTTTTELLRQAALAALLPFEARLLPGMLRRHRWRGVPAGNRQELLAELRQELRVDCLEHAEVVLALPERERHSRWFRQVQRWVYRQRRRGEPVPEDFDAPGHSAPDETETGAAELRAMLPAVPSDVIDHLLRSTRHHRNGRCNLTATATDLGLHRKQVRRLWAETAAQLGFGDDFVAFWQRRLAEALVGLAADLLRDGGQLLLLPRPRSQPDPAGRLRRIRRIRAALAVRPVPFPLRRQLALVLRPGAALPPPHHLLAIAAALHPDDPSIAAWQFEAHLLAGDLRPAVESLRRARRQGAATASVLLARARLLEQRDRGAAALALLRRALRRWPGEARIAAAIAQVVSPELAQEPPSASVNATARSRSSRASGRAADQPGTVSNQPIRR